MKNAQLIFTTHDTTLLDYRPRKDEALERGYLRWWSLTIRKASHLSVSSSAPKRGRRNLTATTRSSVCSIAMPTRVLIERAQRSRGSQAALGIDITCMGTVR
jgi:hypothetical protein